MNPCKAVMHRPKRSRPPIDTYEDEDSTPELSDIETSDDSSESDDYFDSEEGEVDVEDRYVIYLEVHF